VAPRRITIGEEAVELELGKNEVIKLAENHYMVLHAAGATEVFVRPDGSLSDGLNFDGATVAIESEKDRILRERFHTNSGEGGADGPKGLHTVKAPMPGLVRAISVEVGETIDRTSTLIVLEAMKMENNISSGVKGKITKIHVQAGISVEKNAKLIEVELV